ncbi:MAG: hypothetical protein WAQ28_02100 [Bacteroidia bacterium]
MQEKLVTTCCEATAACVKKQANGFETIDYCFCTKCKRKISIENDTKDIKTITIQ